MSKFITRDGKFSCNTLFFLICMMATFIAMLWFIFIVGVYTGNHVAAK